MFKPYYDTLSNKNKNYFAFEKKLSGKSLLLPWQTIKCINDIWLGSEKDLYLF
ncbi:protein of unknown function [Candidatus Nitrosocosmicus franklandus]|uniref:Uncharacterized protein n=1 Tax=Candidatus Nitrosocosmicus franklandianus TaxID=1798806 RepID=A0A484IC14_9ARCH|nr:protein of unknown function [Candidatus Nitrosocosmicus franklandus]